MSKLVSNILKGQISKIPPIWIMRQAGRYLPEYREVRSNMNGFLDLCYNPKMASKVTLQPIDRFDFDAAIIFSDILVIPHSLGLNLEFKEGEGPVISGFSKISDLKITNKNDNLQKIYEAVSETRSKLSSEKSLIGFAGGPWTICCYIFANNKLKDKFEPALIKAFNEPDLLSDVIDIISEQTYTHLVNKIKAGCDVIKIFESWAGLLSEDLFEKFIIKPTKYIISRIKAEYPEIPVIGFPRLSGYLYDRYINETGIDAVSVDYNVPLNEMKRFQEKIPVQGNLHPLLLFSNKDKISKEVRKIKEALDGKPYIFNLGHGILPKTPIENVEHMIKCVRG